MSPGPLSSALNHLVALLETKSSSPWGPPAGASADELIAMLETSPPTDATYQKVLDKLGALPWPQLWETAAGLARKGPGLDTATYLQLVEDAANRLPNPAPRAAIALTVTLFVTDRPSLTATHLESLDRIIRRLALLDGESQWEVTKRLEMKKDAAEGMLASIMADAVELGLDDIPAPLLALIGNMDFGEFNKPGDMPWAFYIGNAAHLAIADGFYLPRHPKPVHRVWRNYDTVKTIVEDLKDEMDKVGWTFDPDPILAGFKYVKPDIFDWSLIHTPKSTPGWVYEIKPYRLRKLAKFEAIMYAGVLIAGNVLAYLGPSDADGTRGAMPAPNGWFVFESPMDGVIAYRYLRAPKEKIYKRDRDRGRVTAKPKYQEAVEASPARAAIWSAASLAILLELLEEAGWTLAFQ
jgi:hypothetical protein